MAASTTVTPFLWFEDQAEQAANFYVGLFPDSEVVRIQRHGPDGPAFLVEFRLAGRSYMALNGGPHFQLNEAFSMFAACDDQAEVDRLWDALLDGGKVQQCGWLTDRYGLSWQIVPRILTQLTASGTPAQVGAVMAALQGMVKLDVAALQAAYDNAADA